MAATGIRKRHARGCPSRGGRACSCRPTFEASVWSTREGKKIRKSFRTESAAKSWRADATVALRKGELRSPTRITLRQAAEVWLEGAEAGRIRTRSGDAYKPSAIRGYESGIRTRLLPEFGAVRLSELRRRDLQDFADRILAEGKTASTISNIIMPLRVIYRRAIARGDVSVNPTVGLELPAVRGRRDRIVSSAAAAALLDALPAPDRGPWAVALYAGLRRGELVALNWENVDLAAGVLRVERAWDWKAGIIEPKSRSGRRTVPIAGVLRDHLLAHKLASGRHEGFVFCRSGGRHFDPDGLKRRSSTAWRRAGLEPIGLHEARHTFASLMIAAGVNAKALSVYMGHASVTITLDRYGHLMPGNEEEAAGLLDAYLARADTKARVAQVTADA